MPEPTQSNVQPPAQNAPAPAPTGQTPPPQPTQAQDVKFDEWIATQPEVIRKAFEAHETGLRNTVKATRDERDDLAKQIKELTKKATAGSDLEKSLTEIGDKLAAAERRASFMEEAIKPGIDCRNPKAAFALAISEDLFDRRGAPEWERIKQIAPELFGRATPPGNGGNGANNPPTSQSMNDLIRRAAGRG